MSGWGQRKLRAACGALALTLACASTAARAEVQIEGDEAAVRLTTDQASLGEVLAALKAKFRLRFDESLGVEREVSGTISGSLHRVVVRLLDGYDFIVRRSAQEGVEIVRVTEPGRVHTAAQPRAFMWRVTPTKTASTAPIRNASRRPND